MGCWGPPGGQSCRENALSDFTAYFTTFFRKKIHPPMGFSTSSEILVEKPRFFALFSLPGKGGFRMCSAAALHIFSGRIILNRATPGGLRTARCGVFTGGAGAVSGRTRACFLRKQLPWENPLRPFFRRPRPLRHLRCHLSQRERLWRNHSLCNFARKFAGLPRALPLGELANPQDLTERARPLSGGTLSGSLCSPAPPRGELLCIYWSAVIDLPLSGEVARRKP